jgi:glycosyltransferase involved in cell wall biosynthesis
VHQTLIHFDKSNEAVYQIKKIDEIIIPLINFPFMKHFLSFVYYWAKTILFNRNIEKFDLVFWHSSRVYPFFFLIPSHRVFINLHDANARIINENTFWTRIFYWNLRLSVRIIDVIFGVSNDACDKLVSVGKFPISKVRCLYPGSNFGNLNSVNPLKYELKEKIFVCISRWQSFKNVENLVVGYGLALGVDVSLPRLILVGKNHNNLNSSVSDLISSMRLGSNIITLQDLKDEELAFLLDNAEINITPSLHEGFGLSVLEGIKRGCPSLDHKFTSTSEISGIAGIHIDMKSVSEISNSLIYINQNPKKIEELRSKTKEISDKFTWQHTVDNLIDLIKNINEDNIV